MTKVNNVAAWAWSKKYLTIRLVNGEFWFYDAWDDADKAMDQCWEEELELRKTERCEKGWC